MYEEAHRGRLNDAEVERRVASGGLDRQSPTKTVSKTIGQDDFRSRAKCVGPPLEAGTFSLPC
jgi:hypothetical protein